MSPVLVTGGSGYVGTQLIGALRSSIQLIKATLDGTMTVAPGQRFADLRDVADWIRIS